MRVEVRTGGNAEPVLRPCRRADLPSQPRQSLFPPECRDMHMPDREVWLSEFGYDTDAASPQAAPAVGASTGLQVQGQWLLRSVLALAATGCVSRAHMYMLADVTTGSWGVQRAGRERVRGGGGGDAGGAAAADKCSTLLYPVRNAGAPWKFATSGLLTNPGYAAKPSWCACSAGGAVRRPPRCASRLRGAPVD